MDDYTQFLRLTLVVLSLLESSISIILKRDQERSGDEVEGRISKSRKTNL